MNRSAVSVLVLAIAFGVFAQAQPGAGMSRGGIRFAGRGFVSAHGVHGFDHRGFQRRGFTSAFVPFWWDEPFAYDSSIDEEAPPEPSSTPPMVIIHDRPSPSATATTPATPKLIEIPLSANTASSPQQVAVFVLKDGTRVESRRYVVTAENAYLTTDRRQRMVPLSQLDIPATVSANHERGIELRIPNDRNEISLSF